MINPIGMGPLYYHASKIIECREGQQKLIKDKKNDVENKDGVIMHFTPEQALDINRQLRELSQLKAKTLVQIITNGGEPI